MSLASDSVICLCCGQTVERKSLFRGAPCEVCSGTVCLNCIRRKQVLPPSWEMPAGTFKYRCKRHVGAPFGLGWQKIDHQ